MRVAGQVVELFRIDFQRLAVMGGQLYVIVLFFRFEFRQIAAVQLVEVGLQTAVFAYFVQYVEKPAVTLAVDFGQFHGLKIAFLKSPAGKKVGRIVIFRQHLPFLGFGNGR